ncbi:MAG: mechanosensitive ion channel family protein [Firmicutes bacterium]|nr:mechanosensitive ion channel family protein [Bacillota bacterium]
MSDKNIQILMNWAWAILIFLIGIVVMQIIIVIVRRAMNKAGADPLLVSFATVCIRVVVIAIALIAALEKVGVNPSSFVTVLGVSGAAVALAVKDSLANIAGGIMIILTHQFKADDYVEIGGYGGYVQKTDLIMTTLRTYDNDIVSIPNSIVNSSIVKNHDANEKRRIVVHASVDIKEDIAKSKAVLIETAKKDPYIIDSPAPAAEVIRTGGGVCEIDLMVWCRREEYWPAYYAINEAAIPALQAAGIKTRSKTQDITIASVPDTGDRYGAPPEERER